MNWNYIPVLVTNNVAAGGSNGHFDGASFIRYPPSPQFTPFGSVQFSSLPFGSMPVSYQSNHPTILSPTIVASWPAELNPQSGYQGCQPNSFFTGHQQPRPSFSDYHCTHPPPNYFLEQYQSEISPQARKDSVNVSHDINRINNNSLSDSQLEVGTSPKLLRKEETQIMEQSSELRENTKLIAEDFVDDRTRKSVSSDEQTDGNTEIFVFCIQQFCRKRGYFVLDSLKV